MLFGANCNLALDLWRRLRRKGVWMVQQRTYELSEISSQRNATSNVPRENYDRELPVQQDKASAIANWLNSKICGKAC